METFAIIVAVAVLFGVTGYLLGSMARHIRSERRSNNVRKMWSNFGLSIALASLFLVTWITHAIVQWPVFAQEQAEPGEPAGLADYFLHFSQSTLENWQSEFLQLFSFVVLAALLIHRGSAESRDSDDRMEVTLGRIERKLDEAVSPTATAQSVDLAGRGWLRAPATWEHRVRQADGRFWCERISSREGGSRVLPRSPT